MISGPALSYFMTALFTAPPVLPLPMGHNPPMQFVVLDDVAEASLECDRSFNVAPADWFKLLGLARMPGRRALPFWVCRAFTPC